MTISTEVRKAGPFIGNNTAASFPFAFKVFKAEDIIVVRRQDSDGVETVLALTSDYTVTLNGDQDASPGGTVTLTAGALLPGFTLVVTSDIPFLQSTDLTNQGGFYPKVITNALDRLTIFTQQLNEGLKRALTLPITVADGVSTELPLPAPNNAIGWNGEGTALRNISPQEQATVAAYGAAIADQFTGNGTTTVFTLSASPGSLYNMDVSVGGVTLRPYYDYTWDGATLITFLTAPAAPVVPGAKNILVRHNQALPQTDNALREDLAASTGLGLIGFAPALPGAENVNASRFLPQTSPLSYGAFFNGTDDDTAGINKAIAAKGPNSYCVVRFPEGANAKIAGTVLIPSGVKVDLNGSIVNGIGTNTLFEGGKWVGSSIVSSFNDAPEPTLTVDAWVGNGLVQECRSAVKINNWVAGCRVHNLRGYHVNQMLHEKRSFYCEFHNLMAWDPLNSALLPCFHWETAIQAQGAKRCFAVGYTKGHTIQGPNDMESFDTCGAEGCVDGVYITGTASLGGGGSGLTFRNWYLENNGTAIKADPAYSYENIDIDNCFFNENFVTLDGPTILSGRFGRMNKVKTSVARPGNFNMLGNQAGLNGFTIELEDIADSVNRTTPTIDTVGRFFVGPNVRIERVVTLHNGSGLPYARNVESPNLPVERITGNQFGTIPNNTVPFCETFYAASTLNVKTQVPYQSFAMVSYNINIVDTQGSFWVRGIVMGDQVFPLSAGQKTVTLQNNGGFLQLNIGVFVGAATYRGVVKHL